MRRRIHAIKTASKPFWPTYEEGRRPGLRGFWWWASKRKRASVSPDEMPF